MLRNEAVEDGACLARNSLFTLVLKTSKLIDRINYHEVSPPMKMTAHSFGEYWHDVMFGCYGYYCLCLSSCTLTANLASISPDWLTQGQIKITRETADVSDIEKENYLGRYHLHRSIKTLLAMLS